MKSKDFKIVFMGTPEFAVTILDGIINSGHKVVSVVTTPDKPAGRGQKVSESAVKQYAIKKNLQILQPEKLKSEDFIKRLQILDADLFVVVAFRMLPEIIWSMPPKGTINLHASLLPDYRGAAPINWAIINGEKEVGFTYHYITKDIDCGNIIFQEKIPLEDFDTQVTLYHRVMFEASKKFYFAFDFVLNGEIGTPQTFSNIHYYKRGCPYNGMINENWDQNKIDRYIRAMIYPPMPVATFRGKSIYRFDDL